MCFSGNMYFIRRLMFSHTVDLSHLAWVVYYHSIVQVSNHCCSIILMWGLYVHRENSLYIVALDTFYISLQAYYYARCGRIILYYPRIRLNGPGKKPALDLWIML